MTVGPGPDVPMQFGLVVSKEIRLIGSFRFDGEFSSAAALIDRRLVDVAPLIAETPALDEAEAAFRLASGRTKGMKVHLTPGGI